MNTQLVHLFRVLCPSRLERAILSPDTERELMLRIRVLNRRIDRMSIDKELNQPRRACRCATILPEFTRENIQDFVTVAVQPYYVDGQARPYAPRGYARA